MLSLRYALVCALLIFSTSSKATLIISEYIEGSSYNKALEIFNTGEALDFSTENYAIDIYVNGATTPRYSINLAGFIEQQGVYVLAHSSADSAVTSIADILSGSLSFNGDDAIVLVNDGNIVDRIGQIGVDPGSEWGTGLISTQNNTLRRNSDVIEGSNNSFLLFDPAVQWQGYATDDFTGLGHHALTSVVNAEAGNENVSVPLPGSSALILAGMLAMLLSGFMSGRNNSSPLAA